MTITPQQLIALLPLLIVGLTVVVVMLGIAWRRDHFINATLTVIGLNLALLSLYFVGQAGPMDVTPLLRVDGYSMFYTGLVILASLATCTFAYPWLVGYPDNREEFYLLVLIATLGGILLASANHLASLFLGIELISLPLFGLVGYAYRQKRPLEAAIKYMLLSAAGVVVPAVWYGAAVCRVRRPVTGRPGQEPAGKHDAPAADPGGYGHDDCRSWASSCRWCRSSCGRRMCIRVRLRRFQPSWPPPARLQSSRW